jgi:hypothetical protein
MHPDRSSSKLLFFLIVNHVVVFWFLLRVVPSAVKIAPAPLNALASVQEGAPNRQ